MSRTRRVFLYGPCFVSRFRADGTLQLDFKHPKRHPQEKAVTKVPLWLRPLVWNELGLGGSYHRRSIFLSSSLGLPLALKENRALDIQGMSSGGRHDFQLSMIGYSVQKDK